MRRKATVTTQQHLTTLVAPPTDKYVVLALAIGITNGKIRAHRRQHVRAIAAES